MHEWCDPPVQKVCSLHVIVSGVLAQWSNKRIDDHACKVAHTQTETETETEKTNSEQSEWEQTLLLAGPNLFKLKKKRRGKEKCFRGGGGGGGRGLLSAITKKVSHYFISLAGWHHLQNTWEKLWKLFEKRHLHSLSPSLHNNSFHHHHSNDQYELMSWWVKSGSTLIEQRTKWHW